MRFILFPRPVMCKEMLSCPRAHIFHPNYGMIFFEGISLIYCLHLGLMKFDIVYILGYEIRYDHN